ncbi:methyltransferase domain-containing protein [Ktedonosporobacter rubrisoli]|uniref:Methyltransferase domain-containing protein n=1 Tax=Ktedonosporobacter rubrisoli TaxID=2509675 RepID=A0A4P6JJN1_KTERU|nr:class I SAM-dependent methyltransferase [Ktedonosporobacter rubrisoli]QBD75243.1 methyltransferase domain-containing protein [Ktedonosporobacter rubrisoli]
MWIEKLNELILLPREQQFAALQQLRAANKEAEYEAWNTAFGAASLYDAWTQLPFMQRLYRHNRAIIQRILQERSNWHIVEIGGGNGALWQNFFHTQQAGKLTLIDPHAEVHRTVAARLPEQVTLQSVVDRVEQVEIPEADVIVCSLTLHHVAGLDAGQRRTFGFSGDGKKEILQRCVQSVRKRQGIGIINEADCYNEIDLAPEDPVLVDHFLDVYVRRAGRAIAYALEQPGLDEAQKPYWESILRHWCLDQVDYALLSRAQRDVYELDVSHWLGLLETVGAYTVLHQYTDEWNLFQQYVFG